MKQSSFQVLVKGAWSVSIDTPLEEIHSGGQPKHQKLDTALQPNQNEKPKIKTKPIKPETTRDLKHNIMRKRMQEKLTDSLLKLK